MEKYNYLEAVTADAKTAILENLKDWSFTDREELEEVVNDNLWCDDSVTGNGSGSYTFNREAAKEYVTGSDDGMDKIGRASCRERV